MLHFVKYNLIGIINTLITLTVVWVLHQLLDWNLELSNFIGFIAGGCNSYICNRIWNFKSKNNSKSEVTRFAVVFLCSYSINLLTLEGCVFLLNNVNALQPFTAWLTQFIKVGTFANVIANGVYVIVSFGLYKYWVFSPRHKT